MIKTPDDKYLFIGCAGGYQYQWSLEQNIIVKEYGRVHPYDIWSMEITPNGEFQITGDMRGNLKQFSIKDQKLLKQYDNLHTSYINSIL